MEQKLSEQEVLDKAVSVLKDCDSLISKYEPYECATLAMHILSRIVYGVTESKDIAELSIQEFKAVLFKYVCPEGTKWSED